MGRDDRVQPVTERVRGGVPARFAAVVAVTVLVGVVWFGLSGRSEVPSADSPAAPTLMALRSPDQTPPPSPRPSPSPAPTIPRDLLPNIGTVAAGEDAFGVVAWFEDRFYMGVLREVGEGHLRTSMRLHFRASTMPAEVDIIQLWTREHRPALATVAHYDLQPDWLAETSHRATVLLDTVAPQLEDPAAPRMTRRGFMVSVEVQPLPSASFLTVDIHMNSAPQPSREHTVDPPRLEAHLVRDDRLLAMAKLRHRWPGLMAGRMTLRERYDPPPTLLLVQRDDRGDGLHVLAELELEARLLRIRYPEWLEEEVALPSRTGDESVWDYRITTRNAGAAVLLVIEVEPRPETEMVQGTARLIEITRGWDDYGRRPAAPEVDRPGR